MLTYGFNVWIEATVLPFLGVMAAFLFVRYRTNVLVNVRFRQLALSTFIATLLEVSSTLLVDGWSHSHTLNLAVRTVYYAAVYINTYHLMRYVQAYVQVENPKFEAFNHILLVSSFVVLALNLVPGISGFFFTVPADRITLCGGACMCSTLSRWRAGCSSLTRSSTPENLSIW